MPDNEPPDETRPDDTPPDGTAYHPAWMTPEGRLREIPIKDLSAGEQYTEDELRKLRAYWTEARTRAVAEWIDTGTPTDAVPEFVARREEELLGMAITAYDLRCISFTHKFTKLRETEIPELRLQRTHLEHADLRKVPLDRMPNLRWANVAGATLPAWMTLKGGLREIAVRDLSVGEQYTEDELRKLRAYWTEDRTRAVAEWIDDGALNDSAPECLPAEDEYEAIIPDLRGIDLQEHFREPRTPGSPEVLLEAAHLEYSNLTGAHLEHVKFPGAHFEYAVMSGTKLKYAELSEASFDNAMMMFCCLQHASLAGACLDGATLLEAHVERADLSDASLVGADLCGAHLEHTDFTRACLLMAVLVDVFVEGTVFREVHWRDRRTREPDPALYLNLDVRGLVHSDPLFDQFVRHSNFVLRCRETWWNPWQRLADCLWPDRHRGARMKTRKHRLSAILETWPPPLWLLWKVTCDCGRSFLRWALWCLGIAIVFGFIFWLGGVVEVPGPSGSGREPNALTYFYFSIVTFTTLGFGDVTPTGNAGEIWVMIEVILGYIGLGGLISIFTTKLIPPR